MPRHFAKRLYGPYFPYDHIPHESKDDNNYIGNRVFLIFKKILKVLTFKR